MYQTILRSNVFFWSLLSSYFTTNVMFFYPLPKNLFWKMPEFCILQCLNILSMTEWKGHIRIGNFFYFMVIFLTSVGAKLSNSLFWKEKKWMHLKCSLTVFINLDSKSTFRETLFNSFFFYTVSRMLNPVYSLRNSICFKKPEAQIICPLPFIQQYFVVLVFCILFLLPEWYPDTYVGNWMMYWLEIVVTSGKYFISFSRCLFFCVFYESTNFKISDFITITAYYKVHFLLFLLNAVEMKFREILVWPMNNISNLFLVQF